MPDIVFPTHFDVEISSDIPAPQPQDSRRRALFPLSQLEVGQSFAVQVHAEYPEKVRNKLLAAISNFRKKHKHRRFATALRVENGKDVIRCWRVADAES